ncbi:MAG: tetratricopeptide repeat protein [Rhodanobacteraceae bacterium]|nr:tetratricopeptide repeat protein [Rhodanobacteraceae bacterium]
MLNPLRRATLLFLAGLTLAFLVYLPGLHGGWVYDDFAFIVSNPAVHVESLRLSEWAAAANSFPAAHQGRWLGMLSFAGNHYLGGLEPWGYKLANLLIHLLNGCLVALVLDALLALRREVQPGAQGTAASDRIHAVLIAIAWMLLPVNLTAVLYVGQRLESLCNTFVLLGLLLYVRVRARDWRGAAGGLRLLPALGACTLLGVLVKESAVLLPLYAACIEVVLLQWRRRDGDWSRPALATLGATLVVPLIAGLIWLATWVGTERAYSRSYDTVERLLTQGRVLIDYVHWTLLPNLSRLTLYHDDVVVSRDLWTPATTLPSWLTILVLIAAAVRVRRSRPLFALGVLLFFAGHALTSTVIPLMLAFEHRNYFPSIGLLLALASVIGLETRLLQLRMQWVVYAGFLLLYVGTTQLRALEWSHPLRLAASEAAKRPDSVDAQYGYVRTLIRAAGGDPRSELIDTAIQLLRGKRGMPGSGLLFEHALVVLLAKRGAPEEPELWAAMRTTALAHPPRASDVSAIATLYDCMLRQECPQRFDELRGVLEAILTHPNAEANLHSIHGLLLARQRDLAGARAAFARALTLAPRNPDLRAKYVHMLIEAGDATAARAELDALRRLGAFGSVDHLVGPLQGRLDRLEARP